MLHFHQNCFTYLSQWMFPNLLFTFLLFYWKGYPAATTSINIYYAFTQSFMILIILKHKIYWWKFHSPAFLTCLWVSFSASQSLALTLQLLSKERSRYISVSAFNPLPFNCFLVEGLAWSPACWSCRAKWRKSTQPCTCENKIINVMYCVYVCDYLC